MKYKGYLEYNSHFKKLIQTIISICLLVFTSSLYTAEEPTNNGDRRLL